MPRPRSPDPGGATGDRQQLPAGWSSGKLDDGRTYYFNVAKPGAVSFNFPQPQAEPEPEPEKQQLQQQRQRTAVQTEQLPRCVALQAWDQKAGADAETDLIFAAGDGIVIVSERPGQGWLTGRLVGDSSEQTGIFPANFVVRQDGAGSADESDDSRPRTPDPDEANEAIVALPTATAASPEAKANWNAAEPEELAKKKGAYVFDEVSGQWKLNDELGAAQQERQAEYDFYRTLFQQCANEVAQLRRSYDKGVKARFRSLATLNQAMGEDASQWTKQTVTDARWASVEAAASVSGVGKRAPGANAVGHDIAQPVRQQLDEVEAEVETLQPGDMVELHDIANESRRYLNGCRGEILEVAGQDGRCPVRISLPDGSQVDKHVRASQIRRVAPLTVGDTAEVFGLPLSNLLNGAHGTVKAYEPKQRMFTLAMAGAVAEDGVAETVMRRFSYTNLKRVSTLKVGDEVEVHGLTGTAHVLNGCNMYIHRWDSAQEQFVCARITADELQARRDTRKHQMESRREARKVLIHHDPISGTTSYDTTGDGVPDAYDTTGDMKIDTFMEVPLDPDTEEQEKRHYIKEKNLRKKAQLQPGDQVVIHSLQSLEGQRLNGMHGTIVAYVSGRYVVDINTLDKALHKLSLQNLRRVGALQPGDTADVHGLVGDPERVALNGLQATVKEYLAEHALFVVTVLLPTEDDEDEDDHCRSRSPEEFRMPAVNLRPTIRANLERRLKVIFDTLDVDNSGSLTPDEVEQMSDSLDVELRDMLSAVLLAARGKHTSDGDQGDDQAGSNELYEIPSDIFKHLDVSKSSGPLQYAPNNEGDIEDLDRSHSKGDGVVTWEEFRALLGPDEPDVPEPQPDPEPEPQPDPEPVLVAAAVAMLGDDPARWEGFTTIAGALTRMQQERTMLFDELELEAGRRREKILLEIAKQDKIVKEKMRTFKKTQDLDLEMFDQMQADGQSSSGSSDAGHDTSTTGEQQQDIVDKRNAFLDEQRLAYEMKELSLRQQGQKKLSKQEKACEKAIESARRVKTEQIERGARGVIIKAGVHRESLSLAGGSMIIHGEEGADTVIWPVDTEPAVQVQATKPKAFRIGSLVKVLKSPDGVVPGPNRAIVKAINRTMGSLKYTIAYDASYRDTYFSHSDPGLKVVDANNVVPTHASVSEISAMGGLSIAATTVAAGDRMTVVGTKPVKMWTQSECGLTLEATKVADVAIGTVIEVVEVKEWTEQDQLEDSQRIAEKREMERLADEEEKAGLIEKYDGDMAAVRKAMAKQSKSKGTKETSKKGRKSRKEVELGTWVRCRVVKMAPMVGTGPFEDEDVEFISPADSQGDSGWMLAINKTPPKVQASLLPWAIPPVHSWVDGGVQHTGLSTDPADLRQAALDAESRRHALPKDLEMPNSGSAVDLQHLTLLSNSAAGSVLVHNGAKLVVSHGCSVRNSSGHEGHGVVAQPGSQITLENATVAHCTGVGVLIYGGVTAKLAAVDIGHCRKGGISAAKGSTVSVDRCRIHQCSGGPGIRGEAPSAGGLVVRNCEIACIKDGAGVEMIDAVKRSTLKNVATTVVISARSQEVSKSSANEVASSADNGAAAASSRRPDPPRDATASAAVAAAEAWLRDAGVSWRQPSPAPLNENSMNEDKDEATLYSDEDVEPQRGMYPGALRVRPFLQRRDEEEITLTSATQNPTNAMASVSELKADARLSDEGEGGDTDGSEHIRGSRDGLGSGSSSSDLKRRNAKKQKKLSKSQQLKKEQEEAEQRAREEKVEREKKMRLEWPIVSQTVIWGCEACGVNIVGKFDGTIRDNVIELNAAEGVRLSREATGTVRSNRLQLNGLDGLVRSRTMDGGTQLGAEAGETVLQDNFGQNWCIGSVIDCKVRQRLDTLTPIGVWKPDMTEWRLGTERELGCRVPKVNRLRVFSQVARSTAITDEWQEAGGGWRQE